MFPDGMSIPYERTMKQDTVMVVQPSMKTMLLLPRGRVGTSSLQFLVLSMVFMRDLNRKVRYRC